MVGIVRVISLFSAAFYLFSLPAASAADESLSQRQLRRLVDKERQIFSSIAADPDEQETAALEARVQALIHEYDGFIQRHGEFPAGHVAYARLLERIGQTHAARALYIKANQLDPNIALVKNQLGNYLAEEEKFAEALPYYLAAVELDPDQPLYHYQIGNLLHLYRDEFISTGLYTRATLDEQMLEAFATAARLGPDEDAFTYRHAEAFYDLEEPRWDEALAAWQALEKNAKAGLERQTIRLHQARVRIAQNQPDKARALLAEIDAPLLQQNKARLQQELNKRTGAEK